jgi:hypothetical protein
MDPQQNPIPTPKPYTKFLLFFLLAFSFVAVFVGGYFLHDLFKKENPTKSETITKSQPPMTPSPTKRNNPNTPSIPDNVNDTTLFLPGKTYFEDTIIAVAKDAPHQAVLLSARRIERDNSFAQDTGLTYFDGNSWDRNQNRDDTPNSKIVANYLIKSWEDTLDESRVLKESVHVTATLNTTAIEITTKTFSNEIAMRSLPGYTKFMSNTSGTMTINGKSFDAYIVYTRIYSLNASDVQFYVQPLGLTTYWVAFWDENGTFYHIDKSLVGKPTDVYKTHQVAVTESITNDLPSVEKSFLVDVNSDNASSPNKVTITTHNSQGSILELNRHSGLNKAPDTSYTWIISDVDGVVN